MGITIAIVRTATQTKLNHPLNKTQKSPLLASPVRQIKYGPVNAAVSPILRHSLVLWFSFFYWNHLSVSARCIWIELETLEQINKLSFSCNSFILIGSRAGVRLAGRLWISQMKMGNTRGLPWSLNENLPTNPLSLHPLCSDEFSCWSNTSRNGLL